MIGPDPGPSEITEESLVSVLAAAWSAEVKDLSPITMQACRHRLERQILPGPGQLRVRELSIGVLDRRLIVDKRVASTANMCRSVVCQRRSKIDPLAPGGFDRGSVSGGADSGLGHVHAGCPP